MTTNRVQCRDQAEVTEVAEMCTATGYLYSVDEQLMLTFWKAQQ